MNIFDEDATAVVEAADLEAAEVEAIASKDASSAEDANESLGPDIIDSRDRSKVVSASVGTVAAGTVATGTVAAEDAAAGRGRPEVASNMLE